MRCGAADLPTGIRDRLKPPLSSCPDKKMISRPSGLQVGLSANRLADVSLRSSPFAASSPLSGSTQSSLCASVTTRRKARACLSGDNAGSTSPNTPAGGWVSLRFSPVSTDSRNRLAGSVAESLSVVTSHLLSPDHASKRRGTTFSTTVSATFRSGPPIAGITKMAWFTARERGKRGTVMVWVAASARRQSNVRRATRLGKDPRQDPS